MKTQQISAAELAKLCGWTTRRVYQLAQDSHIPQPTDGKFPKNETLAAIIKYLRRDSEALKHERLLLTAATRKAKELELATSVCKYIEVSVANNSIRQLVQLLHYFVRETIEFEGPRKRREKLQELGFEADKLQVFNVYDIKSEEAAFDSIAIRCEEAASKDEFPEPKQQEKPQHENTKENQNIETE